MKKTLLQSLLLILLAGCVVPDPDPRYGRRDDGRNTGNVSRVAERDCINMARDRGYRDAVVDSSQWQGDEYAVSVSEHVPGPNPTMNCVYNPGSGRTRVVSSSQGQPRATHDIDFVVNITPLAAMQLVKAFPPPDYYLDEIAVSRGGTCSTCWR